MTPGCDAVKFEFER